MRLVLARWTETGAWWHSAGVSAVIGTDEPEPQAGSDPGSGPGSGPGSDPGPGRARPELLVERELWRVEAGCGRVATATREGDPGGVFDLSYDWSDGRWQLVGCLD